MKTPLDRIRTGAVVLGIAIVVATIGYSLLGRNLLDSIYMVVITIAGVGYSDQAPSGNDIEKVFTIVVIIVGMAAGAYTIGGFIQLMAEGEIQRALGHHRMSEKIRKLRGHVVICGYGRIGRILTRQIKRKGIPFVIVESSTERLAEPSSEGYLVLQGNATDEQILIDAGVPNARALVTSLPGDADNVFITLTARDLNADMQIIARAEQRSTEKKLLRAGANRVVLPAVIGASQMARLVTHPTAADLMELVGDATKLHLELDEIHVAENCKLVGVSVAETSANRLYRLLIMAVHPVGDEMQFNPDGNYVFQAGDTLIVMGGKDDISRFVERYGLA